MHSYSIDSIENDREIKLFIFVDSLFDSARISSREGLFVEMASVNKSHIEIISIGDDQIIIKMDGIDMGLFVTMHEQGCKCSFHQKNRTGLKNGLTENELMMRFICEQNPFIRFIEA